MPINKKIALLVEMRYKPERVLTRWKRKPGKEDLCPVEMRYKPERVLTQHSGFIWRNAPIKVEMRYKPERVLTHSIESNFSFNSSIE